VSTAQRSKLLPALPTLAEAGVPGYAAQTWYGFVTTGKTPPAIVARLNKEIVLILNRPDAAETLLKIGLEPWPSTPEFFAAHIRSEYQKWGRLVKEIGITAN
jgi:tripartite-type tricarboxylate transporter receptor subunit TctC